MIFRRTRPHTPTFQERLERVRAMGFALETRGAAWRATRGGMAADFDPADIRRIGALAGSEIVPLTDGGFQKFFGARPALAGELETLHACEQDLRLALGFPSLYNQSLGSVATFCRYDTLLRR
ncbi:MAG: hypothetical protein ACE15B_02780 [Bryobacteraceae bacterium]